MRWQRQLRRRRHRSSAATSTASPVGRRRRISPVNTTAASRTLRPLCACTLRPGYGFGTDLLQHRRGHGSQDVEKRCSRVASRNQLCTGRGAHRCLWTRRGMCVGHRRWRNRALNHFRTPVSMANESVVAWKARTRRRALPASSSPRQTLVSAWVVPTWTRTRYSRPISGNGVWRDSSRLPESPKR